MAWAGTQAQRPPARPLPRTNACNEPSAKPGGRCPCRNTVQHTLRPGMLPLSHPFHTPHSASFTPWIDTYLQCAGLASAQGPTLGLRWPRPLCVMLPSLCPLFTVCDPSPSPNGVSASAVHCLFFCLKGRSASPLPPLSDSGHTFKLPSLSAPPLHLSPARHSLARLLACRLHQRQSRSAGRAQLTPLTSLLHRHQRHQSLFECRTHFHPLEVSLHWPAVLATSFTLLPEIHHLCCSVLFAAANPV